MKLLIDAVGVRSDGGLIVLRRVVSAALDCTGRGDVVVVATAGEAAPELNHLDRVRILRVPRRLSYRLYWASRGLQLAARLLRATTVICLNGVDWAGHNVPQVTFVQQSVPYSREALRRYSWRSRSKLRIVRELAGRACRRSSYVAVQTDVMAVMVRRAHGLSARQVRVYEPDLEWNDHDDQADPTQALRLMEGSPSPRILYVGSREPHKNVAVLFGAMRVLRTHLPNATLWGTWDGAAEATEGDAAALGHVDPRLLPRLYRSADVVVLPSLAETVGMSLLEAMAAGVPIAIADRPYGHAVAGPCGWYFDPNDPRDLARTLHRLLTNEAERTTRVRCGRETIKNRRSSAPYRRMLCDVAALSGGR